MKDNMEFCHSRFQYLISWRLFKNSCIITSIAGCWKWLPKRPAYLSSGNALSLNFRLFLGFSFLVSVSKCMYVAFLDKYRFCAITHLIFTLRYGTICIDWLRLSRNHLRRNLRGCIYSQRPLTLVATRHMIALRWCNIWVDSGLPHRRRSMQFICTASVRTCHTL
jgi:hypothetical protein